MKINKKLQVIDSINSDEKRLNAPPTNALILIQSYESSSDSDGFQNEQYSRRSTESSTEQHTETQQSLLDIR